MNNFQEIIMNKPLVSVVIPTYKRPSLICRAVDSILMQDYENFEIIIIDDNGLGTENQKETEKILEKNYNDARIRYLPNKTGSGGGGARNAGISAARGEYIAFLDDDEDWLPGKLTKQMDAFLNLSEKTGVIDTGVFIIKDGVKTYREPDMQGYIYKDLLSKKGKNAPKLSTLVCKKKYIEEAGFFDPEFKSRQDLDFYLRLSRVCEFASINEPFANKRVDAVTRISTNNKSKIQGYELLYKKYYTDYLNNPDLHAEYLIDYSLVLLKGHEYNYALKIIFKAIGLDKYNVKMIFRIFVRVLKTVIKSFTGNK